MSIWGTMTLGELIDALKKQPADQWVCFDFCNRQPSGVSSYRGFYDHLAIEHTHLDDWEDMLVRDLVALLEGAIGKAFTGWKGGEYTMGRDTPVWVANPGQTGSTGVVGICDCDYMTIIKTEWLPV